MPKPDSPPLLTAGIHRMTLPELEQLAVSPFPDDDQRQRLFLLFQQWVSNLQTKYVSAILWIDGPIGADYLAFSTMVRVPRVLWS